MKRRLLSKGKKYDNMGMIEVGGGNMKRKSGFTLIELLAVIVILAIIALISTPIILSIINDSREKSNRRSVEGLGKAVETTIGEIMMDSDYTGSDIVCKNYNYMSKDEKEYKEGSEEKETYCWDIDNPEGTIKQVTYSGARVVAGAITFNKDTGKIVISNAQVGSSGKRYTTEGSDSALAVITNKLDLNDNTMFTDPYGNIRYREIYRGKKPNNYVEFNGESWRIIGIVDGKVKIIRNDHIGSYSWDTSESTINNGYGINEWSQADLMKLLNPGYESESIGGSLYWNRTGDNTTKCYKGQGNGTVSCNFSTTGLRESAKAMIEKSTWYLGTISADDSNKWLDNMHELIDMEKGNKVVQDPKDGITRTTRWTGYVGLIYLSDYGYASSCSASLYYYKSCSSFNWLYKRSTNQWTMSPKSRDAYYVRTVAATGVAYDSVASTGFNVYPVVNLKSDVKITGGTGTDTDPYTLSVG